MRTLNKRTSNYELVYSTRNVTSGSRDGSAGDRPSRRSSGSRRGGAGSTTKSSNMGNPSRRRGYFEEDKPENYSPSDVIKRKQRIRERGEDSAGEGDENAR